MGPPIFPFRSLFCQVLLLDGHFTPFVVIENNSIIITSTLSEFQSLKMEFSSNKKAEPKPDTMPEPLSDTIPKPLSDRVSAPNWNATSKPVSDTVSEPPENNPLHSLTWTDTRKDTWEEQLVKARFRRAYRRYEQDPARWGTYDKPDRDPEPEPDADETTEAESKERKPEEEGPIILPPYEGFDGRPQDDEAIEQAVAQRRAHWLATGEMPRFPLADPAKKEVDEERVKKNNKRKRDRLDCIFELHQDRLPKRSAYGKPCLRCKQLVAEIHHDGSGSGDDAADTTKSLRVAHCSFERTGLDREARCTRCVRDGIDLCIQECESEATVFMPWSVLDRKGWAVPQGEKTLPTTAVTLYNLDLPPPPLPIPEFRPDEKAFCAYARGEATDSGKGPGKLPSEEQVLHMAQDILHGGFSSGKRFGAVVELEEGVGKNAFALPMWHENSKLKPPPVCHVEGEPTAATGPRTWDVHLGALQKKRKQQIKMLLEKLSMIEPGGETFGSASPTLSEVSSTGEGSTDASNDSGIDLTWEAPREIGDSIGTGDRDAEEDGFLNPLERYLLEAGFEP